MNIYFFNSPQAELSAQILVIKLCLALKWYCWLNWIAGVQRGMTDVWQKQGGVVIMRVAAEIHLWSEL